MHAIRNSIVVFILLSFSAPFSLATENRLGWQSEVKKLISELGAERGFNGSVAIKIAHFPLKTFTVGLFDEQTRLSPEHLFSSGSFGKQFTTVAVLKLQQDGKLELEDRIVEYLPSLPSWAEQITVRNLLNHTSGLPKIKWKKNIDTEDVMSQVQSLASLPFEPGTSYLYGNINVMLRAKIVEKVTGVEFRQYLQTTFFAPLNMQHTLQFSKVEPRHGIAVGDYPTAINGVTLYTTAADMVRWEIALLAGNAISGKPVTEFLKPHPLSGKDNHAEFDFGFFLENSGEVTKLQHDGSNPSHHVLKYTDVTNQFIFAAMSNDGDKGTLYLLKDKISEVIIKHKVSAVINRH